MEEKNLYKQYMYSQAVSLLTSLQQWLFFISTHYFQSVLKKITIKEDKNVFNTFYSQSKFNFSQLKWISALCRASSPAAWLKQPLTLTAHPEGGGTTGKWDSVVSFGPGQAELHQPRFDHQGLAGKLTPGVLVSLLPFEDGSCKFLEWAVPLFSHDCFQF